MAKKSKTQRAKASAARQQRKAERGQEGLSEEKQTTEIVEEKPKKGFFKKSSDEKSAAESSESKKSVKKIEEKKPKKKRFKFFHDVRAEMKRVTWPTRVDVVRWSGVVVMALLFFGVFVALLDNVVITPLLILISGI